MRYLIFSLLLFGHFCESFAQSICDNFQTSTDTSIIFIPSAADLRLNNLPLPSGSILVAIDPQGNCSSAPTPWMGQDLNITINGQNFMTEGFINNDLLRFLVGTGDSCFVEVDSVYFDVNGMEQVSNFAFDSTYVLSSFNAIDTFGIDSSLIINPMCDDTLGSAMLFVSGGQEPFSYKWSHDVDIDSPLAEDLPIGNYQVTVSDNYGCFDTLSFELFLDPPPVEFEFQIDSGSFMCDTVVLSNALDCPNCTYIWSNGVFEEETIATEPGSYVVLVSNSECQLFDTIEVDFLAIPEIEIFTSSATVCVGDTITLTANGAINYEWTSLTSLINEDNDFVQAVISEPSIIGVYGNNNCKVDTGFIQINTYSFPSAGPDQCFARGNQPAQLQAYGAVEYLWEDNPVGPVSDDSIQNPFVSPSASTEYVVNFVDENGCENSDTVLVEFIDDILEFTTLYNVITPNGDGKNDVLFFDAVEKANASGLLVYDRRKKIVYESDSYQNDWGGTYKGDRLPAGTYYYVLTINGTPFQSNLTIIYD